MILFNYNRGEFMGRDYTKEEIKQLVYSDSVDVSNFNDILNSLLKYDFDMEIREIFDRLADNPELPNSIRENLERVVEAYDQIVETKEETIEEDKKIEEVTTLNGTQQGTEEVVAVEQIQEEQLVTPTEEITTVEPEVPLAEIENVYDDTISTANSYYSNDDRTYLNNDMVLAGVTAYAVSKGINVMSQNPGIFEYPELSLELDENSKPYIDNFDYFYKLGYEESFVKKHPELFVNTNIWRDDNYYNAQDLYDDGVKELAKIAQPVVTVKVTALDMKAIDDSGNITKINLGDCIRVYDEDLGVDTLCNVIKREIDYEQPHLLNIEVTNSVVYHDTLSKLFTNVNTSSSIVTSGGNLIGGQATSMNDVTNYLNLN